MYLPLGRQGVRLVAQVPGHNKKALRRGGNIIAPFCLPVNRYLKICPTTAHFFAAGSRSVPGGVAEPLPYRLTLPLWCLKGGVPSLLPTRPAFSLRSFPHPPDPLPGGKGGTLGCFMQGAAPLASPRLNPRGTGKWGRTKRPAGGVLFLSPANPAFRLLSRPHPPDPLPGGKGGDFYFISPGATAPGTPALDRLRHLQNLPSGCPAQRGSLCFGAKQTEPPFFGQCRQPRRGGTGGEELRRLRWSSPPGQGEQVPLGFILSPPLGTTAARSAGNKEGTPLAGYHSGKVSRRPTGTSPRQNHCYL